MRWLVVIVCLSLFARAEVVTPVCRYLQTTFPNCSTTCVASCLKPTCTSVCESNECSYTPRCKYDCSTAVYDNTTCPNCDLVCADLVCNEEDNCSPSCDQNCTWACDAVECAYPQFEKFCDATYCGTANSLLLAPILLLLFA